jgi:hypothetical protein
MSTQGVHRAADKAARIRDGRARHPIVPTGTDAQVEWDITGADEVRIMVGDNPPTEMRMVKWADCPDGYNFRAADPGPVTIVATNRYGLARCVIGDVALYEVPPFSLKARE